MRLCYRKRTTSAYFSSSPGSRELFLAQPLSLCASYRERHYQHIRWLSSSGETTCDENVECQALALTRCFAKPIRTRLNYGWEADHLPTHGTGHGRCAQSARWLQTCPPDRESAASWQRGLACEMEGIGKSSCCIGARC